jgi:serine/threonine-protein kinase HipA
VATLLDQATSGEPFGPGAAEDELRISLAGAQEKTALLWHHDQWCRPIGATPTTHILKLPLGRVGAVQADFSTSIENEWLCARVLSAYGLLVAPCEIAHFGPHKVLVVTRFDRLLQPDNWLARLPQEDFCQVTGTPSAARYQNDGGPGIDAILDKLRGSQQAEQDRKDFLLAQLLFWLLAAPDGHGKNFSIFLEAGGSFRLTPFYDVMSAWPVIGSGPNQFDRQKLKLAMSVKGSSAHYRIADIQRRHWNATAKRNAMGPDFEESIERVLRATPEVIKRLRDELPATFPAAVSAPIFQGLTDQAGRLAGAK